MQQERSAPSAFSLRRTFSFARKEKRQSKRDKSEVQEVIGLGLKLAKGSSMCVFERCELMIGVRTTPLQLYPLTD